MQTNGAITNYQNRFWLWLGIVWETLKLTRYQNKKFSFITFLEQRQRLTHSTWLSEQIIFTPYSANLHVFDPGKKSPFPLAQGIQLHVRPWILFLAFFPAILAKNLEENLAKLTILIRQRDNFHAGATECAWISADIWRQDGAICSKNRKIVPYHRCARILRLTVSIPDYGPWDGLIASRKGIHLKNL